MGAPPASPWRLESRLPWPGVRGRRLWHHITTNDTTDTNDDDAASDDDEQDEPTDDDPTVSRGRRPSLAMPATVRYNVEMCETTAGHIALVLVRRDGAEAASPVAPTLAIPRVLYVVDAVPPKRASTSPATSTSTAHSMALKRLEPRWAMLTADTRAHSFNGATSASDSAHLPPFRPPLQEPHHVHAVALVEELFTTTRAMKDACVLAKPPLLCARFDCRLVAVHFGRTDAASPLRCVVAREDGMCYLWEWSADLHTWSFLNRFCFLENPNLKWTRPVLAFAAVPHASADSSVETTELAWWSAETKDEPKLFVRKIQFGVEKSTFRTEIRIGSAFDVPNVRDVVALWRAPVGLWVVSRSDGVHLRSVETLDALALDWPTVWGSTVKDPALLSCVHSVTGELVVLHGASGRVALVTPRLSADGNPSKLAASPLLTLQTPAPTSLATHRQLLVALSATRVDVYSVVSGACLASLALPTVSETLSLWTSASTSSRAGASAVGLVGARGYWQLRVPSGHALVQLHRQGTDALRVARPYGATLAFDAARVALELLSSARALVGPAKAAAWDAAVHRLSSPALVLATPSAVPTPRLLDDMTEFVAAIYRVTHDVVVTGRFGSAVEKRDDAQLLRGLPFVTPANVDALHHLANWVLLAKRKLARLQSAVVHKGARHVRARTVSTLSTFAEDDDVLDDPAVALRAVDDHVEPHKHDDPTAYDADADEASSSQLSRKLRPMTSLQFAAGSCSTRHGAQWLAQLESLLLPPAPAPPHALLFHEERSLADFQVALSSFSKHLYFESMVRLYLLHAPTKAVAFVRTIAQFAPRLFTLSGGPAVERSHAERALALLPPAETLVERVRRRSTAMLSLRKRTASTNDLEHESDDARATLLVYAELLCLAGHALEACRVLLNADLYDDCVAMLLNQLPQTEDPPDDAVRTAVFFALLDFCVAHRSAADLEALFVQKPSHVDALLVLRALRQLLPLQMVHAGSSDRGAVSVGALRKVLLRLVREHSAATRATSGTPK